MRQFMLKKRGISVKTILSIVAVVGIAALVTQLPSRASAQEACKTVAQCAQEAVDAAIKTHEMIASAVPKGAVMAFDLDKCPDGWMDLPQTAGRVVVGAGERTRDMNDRPLTPRKVRDAGGEEIHKLTVEEMPAHTHSTTAVGKWGDHQDRNGVWGWGHDDGNGDNGTLTSAPAGNDKPHNVMQPYLVLRYCERR
jgi:hypothetical protein